MSSAQPGTAGSKVVDVAQVSLPRLLFSLLHQRFTGTIVMDQVVPHPGRRTIWFRGGMPVFTDWSEPTEVLGQVLIGQRLITEQDLLGALETMARRGGLLGQTLLQAGKLQAEQLTEGLRRQCSRKVAKLAGVSAGAAMITPVEHGVGLNDGMLPVNALEVIHAAVSTHYDGARAASEMGPSLHAVLQATPSLNKYVNHFRFRPTDKYALQALVHGTQVARIATLEGMTSNRAAQLVYLLWACQMLRVTAPAAGAMPQPPASMPPPAPAPGPEAWTPAPSPPSRPVTAPHAHVPVQAPPVAPAPTATATPANPTPAPPRPPTPPKPPVAGAAPKKRGRAETKREVQPLDVPGIDPEFAKALLALEEKIAGEVNPFALFGLKLDATKKDVRKAWGDLSRRFHPDALAASGLEVLRERVGEAFAALSEANQILADNDRRAELAAQVAAGDYGTTTSDATAMARAAFEAELVAKEGEKLMRSNNFPRALERFRDAAAIHSDPSTEASIAWCEFQVSNKTGDNASAANAILQRIVEEFPNIAAPHYYRGFVLVALGHADIAITEFTEAYKLDPRLIDAERQGRTLRIKKKADRDAAQAQAQGRKGLRGLFGGKK